MEREGRERKTERDRQTDRERGGGNSGKRVREEQSD